jgi:predicted DNA-binding protein
MNKDSIYSIRLTAEQRARLDRKAQDFGIKPSELLRTQIFKLLDYGTGYQNSNSHRKG